ncbi:MAG: amino acid ABC transporter ATP-binding protein, partial [Gammaproteobacteria bacterium]|nr:amino acid ABC transporter ATP-binding protein [Gammaproteobacteria bacterium]
MKVSTELHQAAPPLLELSGVMKRFGTTIAVNGVDLEVERGQVLCIIGPSGCGKSTLLRCVNWLETPDQGTVRLNGAPIGNTGPRNGRYAPSPTVELNRMRARIGMIYQQFNVWPHLSVLDNVMRAQIVVLRRDRITARARSMALLDRVGLADRAHAHPQQLSGGQCQRVAIARALAMDPELLLLDEPTSALDPELVGEVMRVMQSPAAEGRTMIVVTHEMSFARDVSTEAVFMHKGKI